MVQNSFLPCFVNNFNNFKEICWINLYSSSQLSQICVLIMTLSVISSAFSWVGPTKLFAIPMKFRIQNLIYFYLIFNSHYAEHNDWQSTWPLLVEDNTSEIYPNYSKYAIFYYCVISFAVWSVGNVSNLYFVFPCYYYLIRYYYYHYCVLFCAELVDKPLSEGLYNKRSWRQYKRDLSKYTTFIK